MRAACVLAVAVSIASGAGAAPIAPAEVWQPVHWIIGSWKGTTGGAAGPVKVKRTFASAPTNRHLEITETGGGLKRAAVWGIVSFDHERQVLALRRFAADGSVSDLTFDLAASAAGRLVFISPESEATRARITYERTASRTLIERIEQAAGTAPWEVVSQTTFARTD